MYSGSASSAKVRPSKILTPRLRKASSWPLKAVKSAVVTVAFSTPSEISIIVIEPSGSTSSPGSPSFATTIFVPSGVKVSISGNAPIPVIRFSNAPSVSKKATAPGSCSGSLASATATIPSLTATLLTPAAISFKSIEEISVGSLKLLRSRISIELVRALTTNNLLLCGSKADISAPPSASSSSISTWYLPSWLRIGGNSSGNSNSLNTSTFWILSWDINLNQN